MTLIRLKVVFALISGLILLQGCATDMQAARASLNELLNLRKAPPVNRDPNYAYLRVESPQGRATLALGYRLPENNTEVWFSADKTTFYLQQGRYLSSKNMALNWQDTRIFNAPDLSIIQGSHLFIRERIIMPGHHGPIKETVAVEPTSKPPHQAPSYLKKDTEWLVEYVSSPRLESSDGVIAYYARNPQSKKIIWSMQCLSSSHCIIWEALQ